MQKLPSSGLSKSYSCLVYRYWSREFLSLPVEKVYSEVTLPPVILALRPNGHGIVQTCALNNKWFEYALRTSEGHLTVLQSALTSWKTSRSLKR